jgi:hypothetical protein
MLQDKAIVFVRSFMDGGVKDVLQIVARSEGAEVLEQQLLCGKTSQLMALILDGMLMTIQVPTQP